MFIKTIESSIPMKNKVSVIIPVYNVKDYIQESVKSVLNQSYKNLEIIIVNDGSEDNSIELIENYIKESSINCMIVNQENKGLPSARNAGLRIADGEFVCFIDSDDIIERNHIKKLVTAFENNDVCMAFSRFEITSLNNRAGNMCNNTEIKYLSRQKIIDSFLKRSIPIHCCATMFRRDFLLTNNLWFNERLKFGEDVDFLWRVLTTIKCCGYYKEASYKYLNRPNSLMTKQKTQNTNVFISEFYNTVNSLDVESSYKQVILSRTYFGICHACAKNSDYIVFDEVLSNKDLVIDIYSISQIRDFKILMLSLILKIFPRLFWIISKIV